MRCNRRRKVETLAPLQVKDLTTVFHTARGVVHAVDGVSFEIGDAEALGVVGESGCGKSVTGLSLMRLVADPPGRITAGSVRLDGTELLELPEREMRKIRGAQISMVFQEPMTSLNPVFTVGDQIGEVFRLHQKLNRRDAAEATMAMLKTVGIPNPEARLESYPHELSGGMRQRVMIAMALACRPKLLIADEPTTALDVTIQAQILELLQRLQSELRMGILLISHNLGVIAALARRVAVMYAGRIVELADMESLYKAPLHPYTIGLYASLPSVARAQGSRRLQAISGVVPELLNLPTGCKFRNRCPMATEECGVEEPALRELRPGHFVRCIHAKP